MGRKKGTPLCHPDRPNWANGLCRSCYQKKYRAEKKVPNKVKAKCHPDRPNVARGLCNACYLKQQVREPIKRFAPCHPDRKLYARGLCRSCYYRELGKKERSTRAKCHPDREHKAKGLCSECYEHERYIRQRDKMRQRTARWRKQNVQHRKAWWRQYYLANKERIADAFRRRYQTNPEPVLAKNSRRRARLRGSGAISTEQDRRSRAFMFGNCCAYCGDPYQHLDHLRAIDCGGLDDYFNLVPACERCNCSKGVKEWKSWYRKQPFYSKERERFIQEHSRT